MKNALLNSTFTPLVTNMFVHLLILFGAVIAALTQGSDSARGTLLVSYTSDRQVALLDLSTQKVLVTLPSVRGPHEIIVSRDRKLAFVADSGTGLGADSGDSIVVVDLTTRRVKQTIKVCESPHDIRVSRDGRLLWVACAPSKAVVEVDARTGATLKTWNLGLDGGWFVESTPDGQKLYVPHLEGKALTVTNRKTGQVTRILSGTTLFAVSISPNGRELWVSDADENKLSIIDTATDTVTGAVALPELEQGQRNFSRLIFTSSGDQVVVVRGSKLIVIDAKRRVLLWSIEMAYPGKVVTVSGDGRHAFVSHPGDDRVSVINLHKRKVESTLSVGKRPDGVAWVEAPR